MKRRHIIFARTSGDTFVARGCNKTASSTMDAATAVERVAMKLAGFDTNYNHPNFIPFSQTGIKLEWFNALGAWAEWEAK